MLSFGQVKNLLKRFQDCNKSMKILTSIKHTRSTLDQQETKTQPVHFYIRILHYALIEFSTELYRSVLEIIPNISVVFDQKFVECAFVVARRMLNLTPVITVEQFLMQSKWVEKRLQFVVQVCDGVNKWDAAARKKVGKGAVGQLKNFMKQTEPMSKYLPPKSNKDAYESDDNSDDEDLLVQRQIKVRPTEFVPPPSKNIQPIKAQHIGKETVVKHDKPNVFPKSLKNQFMEEQQEQDSNQFIQTAKFPQKKQEQSQIVKAKQQQAVVAVGVRPGEMKPQDQSTEYVSKQQFNEVLEMLANINSTVNGLVSKFNNFQANVTGWFNNTNARIVLLQENVKMIKSNL